MGPFALGRLKAGRGQNCPPHKSPDRPIDIRSLDGERLLESEGVGDNAIAILAGLRDHIGAIHKIVERIAGLAAAERETALAQLTILAGVRHLWATEEQETRKMPIDLDISGTRVLGTNVHSSGAEAN